MTSPIEVEGAEASLEVHEKTSRGNAEQPHGAGGQIARPH